MVGLVFVSHSRALADALVVLVRQMAGDDVAIEVAAGAGDHAADFGTDATAIAAAIEAADSGDGVLILADVGSALMSAEMAIEFLPAGLQKRVRLSAAPFVEGAISAAVQASLDSSLDAVYNEAAGAFSQKREHLAEEASAEDTEGAAAPAVDAAPSATEHHVVEVTLPNPHGLHARPAAQFVRMAGGFDARITVQNLTAGTGPVSAISISAVTTLGATQGHRLRLAAEGPEAEAALQALERLVAGGFGEMPASSSGSQPTAQPESTRAPAAAASTAAVPDKTPARAGELQGLSVQPGAAVGPAHLYRPTLPELPDAPDGPPEEEWQALQKALEATREAMHSGLTEAAAIAADESADILAAQTLILDDPEVRNEARTAIFDDALPAGRAWMRTIDAVAERYGSLDDPYLWQRADDVRDIGRRVVRRLLGTPSEQIEGPSTPHILIAAALAPSDVPPLDADRVLGVVCAAGNPASHSAILLRARGVPAVFDVGPDALDLADGTTLGLDAEEGRVWVDPSPDVVDRLQTRRRHQQNRRAALQASAHQPATTPDGFRLAVEANVSQPSDAARAAEAGADGVGLLRTEFLFLGLDAAPSEEDQVEALAAVAGAFDDAPITVRVLDAGGDKPLPYVPVPAEANPFLGVRGIRMLLRHRDLFRTQLRAILRVAADHRVRLLLPMIATPSEVEATRDLLDEVRVALQDEGHPHGWPVPLGAMVETPASAVSAGAFARRLDFLSIGTNDLTQYTMAADREHSELSTLTDALHPPVLRLIRQTVEAATLHDCPVRACGEAAADPLAVPILMGLGVVGLSVSPPSVVEVKALVRAVRRDDAEALANDVLALDRVEAVRGRARAFVQEHAAGVVGSDAIDDQGTGRTS